MEIMEMRHDWAKFNMTPELFKYVLTQLIPDVVFHTREQDQVQIRDNYDREFFCNKLCVSWIHWTIQVVTTFMNGGSEDKPVWCPANTEESRFLGPRMIYTSGIVTDITQEETLEQLQDNKLTVVCEKLNLQPTDRLLDIGHVIPFKLSFLVLREQISGAVGAHSLLLLLRIMVAMLRASLLLKLVPHSEQNASKTMASRLTRLEFSALTIETYLMTRSSQKLYRWKWQR